MISLGLEDCGPVHPAWHRVLQRLHDEDSQPLIMIMFGNTFLAESFKQEVSLIQRIELDGIKLKQPKHDSEPIHNTIGWAEQNQTSAPKASRTVASETIV